VWGYQFNTQGVLTMSTYQIDPAHSTASFSIKHMMIAKVRGAFDKMSGKLVYDPTSPAKTSVEVSIDTASINTHEAARDTHLKSPDFFDVEKFPVITFKSSQVQGSGSDFKVTGDLTIRGVTQKVMIEVEAPSAEIKDPWGNIKIGVSGKTQIKRKDFGLSWNAALEAGGFLVGDDVTIELDIQLTKQA
jgi:polyisoprenoid-binding protein YceI